MDITVIVGIVAGISLVIWGIALGGDLGVFYDFPSIVITLGGTLAGTLISYSGRQLREVGKTLRVVFQQKQVDPLDIIDRLVAFATKARREGLLALESDAEELDDDFLKKGIQLIVDGTDPELVRSIMETDLAFLEERHKDGKGVFDTAGTLAPAFGMIGTLIGLVSMLKNLNDPDAIGPGMATALLTTFYGAMLANLLFIPLSGKLAVKSREEIFRKEIMVEGILSVQAGDNPRIVEEKLKAFLSPRLRLRPEKKTAADVDVAPSGNLGLDSK